MPWDPYCIAPPTYLDPGVYRLKLKLSGGAALDGSPAGELAILEIMSQRNYLGHGIITASDLAKREFELDIAVTEDRLVGPGFTIQTLLRTFFPVDMAVSGLTCEQLSDANPTEPKSRALTIKEWLPLLWTGPGAIRQEGKIVFASVKSGIAFYGPCFGLPEGNYEAVFGLASEGWKTITESLSEAMRRSCRYCLGKNLAANSQENRSRPGRWLSSLHLSGHFSADRAFHSGHIRGWPMAKAQGVAFFHRDALPVRRIQISPLNFGFWRTANCRFNSRA